MDSPETSLNPSERPFLHHGGRANRQRPYDKGAHSPLSEQRLKGATTGMNKIFGVGWVVAVILCAALFPYEGSTQWGTNVFPGNVTAGGNLNVTGSTTLSGTLAVTGNTTLSGTLTALNPVTVSDAAIAPTAAQSGTMWVARPLTAKRTATLPAAAAGLEYGFFVADADSLLITTASGDSLITSAGAAWKTTSSVAGTVWVVAMDATRWVMMFTLGTWTSY